MIIESNTNQKSIGEVFETAKIGSISMRSEVLSARRKRLEGLLKWISSNEDLIKKAVYADFKKPEEEVDISEIYPVTSEIRHALSNLNVWTKPKKIDAPLGLIGTTSSIIYEPKGACLIIGPWNFPFNLTIGPLVSCLAAGNSAVIKPSEMTPHTSELIEKMISSLFQPKEVQVVLGGVTESQELLSFPWDHIFFTGSPAVGKIVMKAASEHLTSVTLELGGKSPVIIDSSCNLDDAAQKIAWGKYLNNGQTCVAPDYILIDKSIQSDFENKLEKKTSELFKANDGYSNSPFYGRIVNRKHYNRLNELLKEALDKGAKLVFGGDTSEGDNFMPPIALKNVSKDSKLLEEEIFGPILPIISFNDLNEALEIINSKPKPLALYYFGNNKTHRKRISRETSSGNLVINDCVIHFGHVNLPFGGVNNSGIGKSHGHFGFLAFSNEKGTLKQRVGFTTSKLIYPPYSGFKKFIIRILKKYL